MKLIATVLSSILLLHSSFAASQPKPNIVFILADLKQRLLTENGVSVQLADRNWMSPSCLRAASSRHGRTRISSGDFPLGSV